MTIYNGDEALGASSLDSSGQATISADTGGLSLGEAHLRVAYSGDAVYAPVSVTLPVAVEPAVAPSTVDSSSSSDLSSSTALTTVTESTSVLLASTGFGPRPWIEAGVLLLGAGMLLLLTFGRRPSRRH